MVDLALALLRRRPYDNAFAAFEQRLSQARAEPFRMANAPAALCHYGTLDAFHGVLKDQTFWSTDHHTLDDPEELKAVEDRVDAVLATMTPPGRRSAALFRRFRMAYPKRRLHQVVTLYVSCFSTSIDDLSLWHSFAKMGGVCMVMKTFNDEAPPALYNGLQVSRSAHQVVYDADESERKIRAGFANVLREFEEFGPTADRFDREGYEPEFLNADGEPEGGVRLRAGLAAMVQLAMVAALAAISSKRDKFKHEAEWRWIGAFIDDVTRYVREKGTKRYLVLPLRAGGKRLEFEKIVVWGPDTAAMMPKVRSALVAAGYDQGTIEIVASKHPFSTSASTASDERIAS